MKKNKEEIVLHYTGLNDYVGVLTKHPILESFRDQVQPERLQKTGLIQIRVSRNCKIRCYNDDITKTIIATGQFVDVTKEFDAITSRSEVENEAAKNYQQQIKELQDQLEAVKKQNEAAK